MKVVGHETVSADRQPALGGVSAQQHQKQVAICVRVKDSLPTVAPPGDMMRQPRDDDPLPPRHFCNMVRPDGVNSLLNRNKGLLSLISILTVTIPALVAETRRLSYNHE